MVAAMRNPQSDSEGVWKALEKNITEKSLRRIDMKLTEKDKAHIDGLDIQQLLSGWRSAPDEDPWFWGETGEYWRDRMGAVRDKDPAGYVRASKDLG